MCEGTQGQKNDGFNRDLEKDPESQGKPRQGQAWSIPGGRGPGCGGSWGQEDTGWPRGTSPHSLRARGGGAGGWDL